jgi:predicted nucleic acid-binding Zn finger protein
MSKADRFYLYSKALGLSKEDAERRALNRIIGVFEFSEITDEQFDELNNRLAKILTEKGIPIPVEQSQLPATIAEKPVLVVDMSIDEIRNMLKPCDHEWNEYIAEGKELETFVCKECTICGAVALAVNLKPGIPCKHESAILIAKSPTKFVSLCADCQFWLIEPMRSRVSS